MQASHEAFVAGYFRVTRERVEDFLTQRWIPVFMEEFVNDAVDGKSLDEVLAEETILTDDQRERLIAGFQGAGISDAGAAIEVINDVLSAGRRGTTILEFAQAATHEIELKRRSLVDPIDQLERESLDQLRTSYAQIQQAQSAVTGHLRSLLEVQNEQNQILERVGLLEARDSIIDRAVEVNEEITGILDAGKAVGETLGELEAKVGSLTGGS